MTSVVMVHLRAVNKFSEVKIVKRIMVIITPVLIIGVLLYILTGFKHVKRLDAREQLVIDRFKKEQNAGVQLHVRGVFSEEEFNVMATSLSHLHSGANYRLFGRKWGVKLEKPTDEFKKINDILLKKEYPQKQKEFLDALKLDLKQAENHYGTRASHDILSDLSYYVFPKENEKKERQYGNPKTLYVMKKMGMKIT